MLFRSAGGGERIVGTVNYSDYPEAAKRIPLVGDNREVDIERIVGAAGEAVRQAGLTPRQIDALYFTGGSTGLRLLASRIAAAFPAAQVVRGDRFASVATGLGLHAQRWFGRDEQTASAG